MNAHKATLASSSIPAADASNYGLPLQRSRAQHASGHLFRAMIVVLSLLLAFVSWALLAKSSRPGALPTVDTGYALFLGNQTRPSTVVYYGVPYAIPPLQDLRWRGPQPLDTETLRKDKATVDARSVPLPCIQGTTGSGDAGGAGSEDCLKVNIYTPASATPQSNLPVLVYIHGGGYVYGNPVNWPFDGWIEQSPNVVIVSVYYRLNAFGFLAVPELSLPENGVLNAGFLDQIEALRWIQENIRAFGGNPEAVVINGESAGASSVELHLVANEGNSNLFRGAIAQSVYRIPLSTAEQKRTEFTTFANKVGCTTGTVAQQLNCLRSASVSAIIMASDAAANYNSTYKSWAPVVDNTVIKDLPTRLILQGKHKKVPVMVGCDELAAVADIEFDLSASATTNETLSGGTDITSALQSFFPAMTEEDVQDILAAYPASSFASSELLLQTVTGESELRCGRELFVKALSKTNTAWAYRYNQPNPTSGSPNNVGHAAENWMMFDGTNTGFNGTTTFTPQSPVDVAFSEELIAYWLSFVRSLSPNDHKLARSPTWASATPSERMVLQEDPNQTTTHSGNSMENESAEEIARCGVVFSKVTSEQN